MKLTVRDLFDIPIMKNFRLVAGEKGLNRPVMLTAVSYTHLTLPTKRIV